MCVCVDMRSHAPQTSEAKLPRPLEGTHLSTHAWWGRCPQAHSSACHPASPLWGELWPLVVASRCEMVLTRLPVCLAQELGPERLEGERGCFPVGLPLCDGSRASIPQALPGQLGGGRAVLLVLCQHPPWPGTESVPPTHLSSLCVTVLGERRDNYKLQKKQELGDPPSEEGKEAGGTHDAPQDVHQR